jgi:hypothetical protein
MVFVPDIWYRLLKLGYFVHAPCFLEPEYRTSDNYARHNGGRDELRIVGRRRPRYPRGHPGRLL